MIIQRPCSSLTGRFWHDKWPDPGRSAHWTRENRTKQRLQIQNPYTSHILDYSPIKSKRSSHNRITSMFWLLHCTHHRTRWLHTKHVQNNQKQTAQKHHEEVKRNCRRARAGGGEPIDSQGGDTDSGEREETTTQVLGHHSAGGAPGAPGQSAARRRRRLADRQTPRRRVRVHGGTTRRQAPRRVQRRRRGHGARTLRLVRSWRGEERRQRRDGRGRCWRSCVPAGLPGPRRPWRRRWTPPSSSALPPRFRGPCSPSPGFVSGNDWLLGGWSSRTRGVDCFIEKPGGCGCQRGGMTWKATEPA